ncbi:MAG: transcriptional repressor [Acidobacteria bacterium]|nr:transcriptional repressor [Acidobacteriota bacterium]
MPARNTKQKEAIRAALESAGRPLTADEVLARAKSAVSGLGAATVYRNLRTLLDESWLAEVQLPGEVTRYELSGKGHHHHFHCRLCGQVFELPACRGDFPALAPKGFEVTGHEVILYGYCPGCAPPPRRPRA